MNAFLPVVSLGLILLGSATRALGAGDDPLATLRKGHPRLLVLDDRLARVREAVGKDPLAKKWHDQLLLDAEKMLKEKPVEHVLKGPRLLDQSRAALRRISTLAGLYRLDGDKRFAERATKEMLNAAAFDDWNPSHYLDVAEMTCALSIGYDWLYDTLSPEDRRTIRTAIVEKGLKTGLDAFDKGVWWTKAHHNWSQVCNGGLTMGALALADEEPKLAREMILHSREAIVPAMQAFAPDGGCPEGPGYWGYATQYNVLFLAALDTALSTDFDLSKTPGFAETGFFRVHCIGPTNQTFNYADAHSGVGKSPQMLWLAERFKQPIFVADEQAVAGDRPDIMHLLWYVSPVDAAALKDVPTSACFRGVNVAFMRSAWNDSKATFVGFKGGDNKANHSHLDLGSFVMDAAGQRWALDLGSDDYNLPGYFGKERFTYYRLRTESHNTLTIDGENQALAGKAPLVAFSAGASPLAIADLTGGYAPRAKSIQRGIRLLAGGAVLVQDEISLGAPGDVTWNFLTVAKIALDGKTATLSLAEQTLKARIIEPAAGQFETLSANPDKPQAQQPNVSNLAIRLKQAKDVRIVVLLSPGDEAAALPKVTPLETWGGKLK